MIPPYFALDIFLNFNSRDTFTTFLDVIDQIVDLAEVCSPGMPTLYSFVSTMEFPKKGCRLHHDGWKQSNEDVYVMDRPVREDPLEFRNLVFPLTPLLNLGTRFLVVKENCNARKIKLQ